MPYKTETVLLPLKRITIEVASNGWTIEARYELRQENGDYPLEEKTTAVAKTWAEAVRIIRSAQMPEPCTRRVWED